MRLPLPLHSGQGAQSWVLLKGNRENGRIGFPPHPTHALGHTEGVFRMPEPRQREEMLRTSQTDSSEPWSRHLRGAGGVEGTGSDVQAPGLGSQSCQVEEQVELPPSCGSGEETQAPQP